MELGQYQLQIFVSLVVILGAAFVALICDLLKGNNEQLREFAIELKVRREEEQKRFQMLLPSAAKHAAENTRAEKSAQPASRQVEAAAEATQVAEAKKRVAAPVGAVSTKEKKRAISPDALAVMERGAQMAAAPRPRRRAERPETELVEAVAQAKATQRPEIELVPAVVAASPATASIAASIIAAPAASKPASNRPAANRDWSSLLSARKTAAVSKAASNTSGALLDAVVAATASDASAQAAEPILPSGFQDGFVLTRLVESRQPVSGLVVSIGASASQNTVGSLPSDVRMLIQSLIGPNDFAAQSGAEEFLLIFPGERGASAQRRLSQVAQQLWDFQLRSLGSFSILFSWGGVEVRSESIDEAIASATERMEETRRGRKILTMESRRESEAPLAQAV
jgi:hypothetical protein